MQKPFLDNKFQISWSDLKPEYIVSDITEAIENAQKGVNLLSEIDFPEEGLTFENTLIALESAYELLSHPWGLVSHLESVSTSDQWREAYNATLPKVTEFYSKVPLNSGLWNRIKAYSETEEAKSLSGTRLRFLEETLSDFQNSGADLPSEDKDRLMQIESDLAQKTQKYSENVLDSTNQWELIVDSEEDLAGLPGNSKAAAFENAKSKEIGSDEDPKWRFTLQAPSYFPVLEHVHSDSIRKKVWEGTCSIGASGDYDNSDLVWEILELRQKKAELLGKKDFADQVLQRRMAKDGATALAFVEDLHQRTKPFFDVETEELQRYKAQVEGGESSAMEPWEIAYWSEKRRKAEYDFDDEELRPYFSMEKVIDGMFSIAAKIFGIRINQPQNQPEVWHEDVKFYEIHDEGSGAHLGSFYTDWFPRESKRSGAWMNYLRTGEPQTDGNRSPHLGLMCGNMTPPVAGGPALLKHDEVETVFHEFGHLLHHLLGEVEVKSLNGVNVAWDFVELPSQIMENFCWDRQSLNFFALHHETNDLIPDDLYKKMMAARNYRSATAMMRQLSLGKLDLELHINEAQTASESKNLDDLTEDLLSEYSIPTMTRPSTMARRFGHLFASPTGYAAAYYSYKWAEVLDADAFTRFSKEGIMNSDTGRDFREKILSKGNSDDPKILFHNFMGREPDPEALLIRSGLVD